MSNSTVSFAASQLVSFAPALFVYLIAFILAIVFMRRALLPSILTLLGVAVLVGTIFLQTAVQAYAIENRQHAMLYYVGIAVSCIRAFGTALLVAAIFVDRHKSERNASVSTGEIQ